VQCRVFLVATGVRNTVANATTRKWRLDAAERDSAALWHERPGHTKNARDRMEESGDRI
jgi:hypothetical protein